MRLWAGTVTLLLFALVATLTPFCNFAIAGERCPTADSRSGGPAPELLCSDAVIVSASGVTLHPSSIGVQGEPSLAAAKDPVPGHTAFMPSSPPHRAGRVPLYLFTHAFLN